MRREDVIRKSVDESETMLYDPQTETIHVLNPSAELIWELCDGEHTPADIAQAIREQYAGTQEPVRCSSYLYTV